MEQLGLEAPLRALARMSDPVTSHAAAAKLRPLSISSRILESIKTYGAADSDALAVRLSLKLVTVSPRLRPLARAGHLVELEVRDGKIVWDVPR